MGYYIEPTNGGTKGKADDLIRNDGAVEQSAPVYHEQNSEHVTVCVVDNGPFEAAGVAYSENEFNVFRNDSSGRPKRWLTMSREKVATLGSERDAKLLKAENVVGD